VSSTALTQATLLTQQNAKLKIFLNQIKYFPHDAQIFFLGVWDRFSGDLIQTIKLKTAAKWIIQKKDKLHVRGYNTDEVFRIEIGD